MGETRTFKHRLRVLATALLLALTQTSCGTTALSEATFTPTAAIPAVNDLAYVVVSAGQEINGGRGAKRSAIATRWSLVSSSPQPDTITYILTADDAANPYVTRVRAGRYELQSFAFGVGGQLYSNAEGMALAEFTVNPGEVVYVGHLLVRTRNGLLGALRNDFRLAVEKHETRARSKLQQLDPGLAARMQTRPMTLSPILQRLSELPR